jgi:hypothetical protein
MINITIMFHQLLRLPDSDQVLVLLSVSRKVHAHGSTIVALHPEVFRVLYFPKGMVL